MRHMTLGFAFLMLAFAAGIASAGMPPIHVEVAGGIATLSGAQAPGEGLSVGVSAPVASWASVGVQGDLYRFDSRFNGVSIPEVRVSSDDTHAGALLAVARFEAPRGAIVPYVAVGTGWSSLRYGAQHVTDMFTGATQVYRYDAEHALASMLDLGFAGRWSRPFPQAQLEVHLLSVADHTTVVSPRLMLRY
jgi:hypothetical protein